MLIQPNNIIKAESYGDFCSKVGLSFEDDFFEDGFTDLDMITEALENLDETYLVHFVDIKDGHFLIFQISK